MKALLCGQCHDIRALAPDPDEWVTCRCGNLSGHWQDPHRGIAEFKASNRRYAFVLGLNNQVLGPAMQGRLGMFQDFRAYHDKATDAPGYVFDKSRAACWAVVFGIGRTSDTSFVEDGDDERADG